ncbi:MAG: TolC family outer membrane protein [Alphaproteobacteria bacterium]|nr:TolC family outer membrane protein [Alphaproteobacteria bacterium]
MAVRTHPTVEAAREAQRGAEFDLDEARSGYFPTVDSNAAAGLARTNNSSTRGRRTRGAAGTSSQGYSQDRYESSFTISQLLFDGWGIQNRTAAAQSRLDAAGFQVFDASDIIGLRATAAYLDVLRSRRLVELADDNAKKHEDVLAQVTERAQSGAGTLADVDQVTGRVAQAQSALLAVINGLRDAEVDYLEAIGEPPAALVRPIPDLGLVMRKVEDAVAAGIAGNSAVRAAAETIVAQRATADAALAPFYPKFDLELAGKRDENVGGVEGPSNDLTAKIKITYNLYRGGGDSARRAAALSRQSEALQKHAETRRTVERAIRTAYNALQIAQDRIPVLKGHAEASERALAAYYEQFKAGNRTLLDALNSEGEAFGARAALLNGEYSVLVSYYRVLATMGLLVRTLDVAVGASAAGDARKAN